MHASHPLGLVNASSAAPTFCAIGCCAKMIAGSLDLSFSWLRIRSAAQARISGVMLIEASSSTGLAAPSEVLSRCGPAIANTNSASTIARMIGAGIRRSAFTRVSHHSNSTPTGISR